MRVWGINDGQLCFVTGETREEAMATFMEANGWKDAHDYRVARGSELFKVTCAALAPSRYKMIYWLDPDDDEVRTLDDLVKTYPQVMREPSYLGIPRAIQSPMKSAEENRY